MNLECRPATPQAIVDGLNLIDVWTVESGLESMADVVAGTHAFDVFADDGAKIGCYALRGQSKPAGVIAWLVVGQGAAPGVDLTRDLLPVIERQANADYLAIQTTRPGLIKKLIDQGYEVGGIILKKKLS